MPEITHQREFLPLNWTPNDSYKYSSRIPLSPDKGTKSFLLAVSLSQEPRRLLDFIACYAQYIIPFHKQSHLLY